MKAISKGSFLRLIGVAAILALPGALKLPAQQPVTAQAPAQTPADNTKNNQNPGATADQQKVNSSDEEITRKIRRAIIEDKSLSTYAHNIKIITQDGVVTLKGPVSSEEEKSNVEAKAVAVAGESNVKNEIQIAQ